MIKKGIYILCFLAFGLGQNVWGQSDVQTKSKTDSNSSLDIQAKDIQVEDQFQNIQQNLLQVSGQNTLEEGVEYYNLGELFMGQEQPLMSKSYYLESLEIYKNAKKEKSSKKRKLSSKSSDKHGGNLALYEYQAYIGLIKACLASNEPKEALKYTKQVEKDYQGKWEYSLVKLDVLQANEKWQEVLDFCDVLEQQKHSNAVDSILINKRTLAKAKLGLDEEVVVRTDDTESSGNNKEFVLDEVVKDAGLMERDEVPQSILQVEGLSYETQDEIANTYNSNADFEKELSVRQNITEQKSISEKQKAKQKLEIGKIYSRTSEKQKAISVLEESLELARESKDIEVQKETLLKLIDIYESDQNKNKTLKLYKELVEITQVKDSLNQAKYQELLLSNASVFEKQEVIKNIQERRNLYQKERSLENKESNLMESQMQFQKIVIGCLIFGLLIAVFVLFWYHRQRQKLKMVNLQLELKNMRNQMNPHFIFNSLNAVNHFIAQRNELLANEYLTEFALLMRNTLNQSDLDLIPLRDELTFLNRYCELEKMRFENKFDFTFTVDKNIDVDAFQIPPLLLQPFVENAVWHGLRYLEDKGLLSVSFKPQGDQLKIEIVDNGIGRERSKSIKTNNQKKHKSKGVNLIKRRIHISNQLTPIHIHWSIEDNTPQGTRVVLLLSKK